MSKFPIRINKKLGSNILIVVFCVVIAVCLTLIGLYLADSAEVGRTAEEAAYIANAGEEIVQIPLLPNRDGEGGYESNPLPIETPLPPGVTPDPNAPTPNPNAPQSTRNPSSSTSNGGGETVPIGRVRVNFLPLLEKNKDVVGWLSISGTVINYPVVQSSKEYPTSYYLSHLYDGKSNIAGSLYIERGTSSTFRDRVNVIRGHRMNNGSMFGGLNKYSKQSYFNKHPVGQLSTPERDYYVYFFAAYETDVDDVMPRNPSDEEYQAYLNAAVSKSLFKANFTPLISDKILTLSTCVVRKDTRRFFLHGILIPMD
ncbi:MAG: class B sortase [Clostridiales bacterium]|nr:class B sortase [Clostridiales bacterium]